jgi:hypothetical protein
MVAVVAAGITALAGIAHTEAVLEAAVADTMALVDLAAKGSTVLAVAVPEEEEEEVGTAATAPVAVTEGGHAAHLEMGPIEEQTGRTVTARLLECPRVDLRGLLNRSRYCPHL